MCNEFNKNQPGMKYFLLMLSNSKLCQIILSHGAYKDKGNCKNKNFGQILSEDK